MLLHYMTFEYVSHCQLQLMMFVPNVSLNCIYAFSLPTSINYECYIFNVLASCTQ